MEYYKRLFSEIKSSKNKGPHANKSITDIKEEDLKKIHDEIRSSRTRY